MYKVQKAVIVSLIGTSAIAWLASIQQQDMMAAMTTYSLLPISIFTASWTAGMAAMMFPAIGPMVLMYNAFVLNKEAKGGAQSSVTVQEAKQSTNSSYPIRSFKVILFVGCYLLVWALTGIAMLLGWSVVMNNTLMIPDNSHLLPIIYGSLLIIAGAYQFTPLKRTCIGFCESPMSFFMRRWREGTFGAARMGLWHGLYCLGCCWSYFLLMVALGWMNLLWMGLFAGIIFGEKMWSRGIWIARATGVALVVVGILVISGMLPSLASTESSKNIVDNIGNDKMDMNNDADNSSQTPSRSSSMMPSNNNGGQSIQPNGPSSMDSSSAQQAPNMNMQ